MKVELQKPGEQVDESKQGRVKKADTTETTDEVSAHGARVTFTCPNCHALLTGWMEIDPQWFRCPDCGFWIQVFA
ncbi:MAG: hypothetical protein JO279_00430 [Verrucomicrobia bacterium]|nr:hypothetical protein [Verrucomicrobiota bacterium]MBV8375447.1 hypothetical protein [Verrucomicrobiota bacterium]